MKKFGKVAFAVVMASAMIVTPVMATPSVDELKQEKNAAENEVSSLQSQLTEIVGKITQLEEDLVVKGEEIIQAQEDLTEAEKVEKKQYEDMKLRIQFLYERGDDSLLEVLMTADSFTDLVNKAEYVQNVHSYDRQKLKEYVETKQKIVSIKTTLEAEQSELQTMQADYEAEEEKLNATIESKQSEIADLGEQLQAALAAVTQQRTGGTGDSNGGNGSRPVYTGTGNTAAAQAIVSAARSAIGVPYVWGGASMSGFDCSGLVMYCHSMAGVSLDHSSGSQGSGMRVSDPQPGDVVCYPGHVGIYIGGGQMIHAPEPTKKVTTASVYSCGTPYYVRYW